MLEQVFYNKMAKNKFITSFIKKITTPFKNGSNNKSVPIIKDTQADNARIQNNLNKNLQPFGASLLINREYIENIYLASLTVYSGYQNQNTSASQSFFKLIYENPIVNQAAQNLVTKILIADNSGVGVGVDFKLDFLCSSDVQKDISNEKEREENTKEREYIIRVLDSIYKEFIKEIGVLSGKDVNGYSILSHTIITAALDGYSFLIWLKEEKRFIHRSKNDLFLSIIDLKSQGIDDEKYYSSFDGMIRDKITGKILKYVFKSEKGNGGIIFDEKEVIMIAFASKSNNRLFMPFYMDAISDIVAITKLKSSLAQRADLNARFHAIASPKNVSTIDVSQGVASDFLDKFKAFIEDSKNNDSLVLMGSDVPLEFTQLNQNATNEGIEMLQMLYASVATSLCSTYAELSGDSSRGNFASEQAQQQLLITRVENIQLSISSDIRKFVNIILNECVMKKIVSDSLDGKNKDVLSLLNDKYKVDFDLMFVKMKSLEPLKDQESLVRLYQAGLMSQETGIKKVGLDPDEESPKIQRNKDKMNKEGENLVKRPYVKSGIYSGDKL